jgi:alpha-D-xyloside xylohydrolase
MPDEFMFGRSILAAPIVEAQYTEEKIIKEDAMTGWDRKDVRSKMDDGRSVDWETTKTTRKYLPKGTYWYDFWTGARLKGGQEVSLQTTFDRVPMFVRAGSILPLGPEMQYVGEKAWDHLELRVYPGADATFTLYEDEGDNYNYERGVYTTIPMTWNDRTRTLTIGQRKGNYPGMLQSRKFTIVLPDNTSKVVEYQGEPITIKM